VGSWVNKGRRATNPLEPTFLSFMLCMLLAFLAFPALSTYVVSSSGRVGRDLFFFRVQVLQLCLPRETDGLFLFTLPRLA
jgi:hypothetical protein